MLLAAGTLDVTPMDSTVSYLGDQATAVGDNKNRRRTDFPCRSVYLPVVRNHLFDLFSLFDYADASMINGNRSTSTIAPQALFMMNSDLIQQVTQALAESLLTEGMADGPPGQLRQDRLDQLYLVTLGRLPRVEESKQAEQFLARFLEQPVTGTDQDDPKQKQQLAWQALCQVLLASNEFVYVR